MLEIWKYPISRETTTLELPKGARIISTAKQHGKMVLYALVKPMESKEEQSIPWEKLLVNKQEDAHLREIRLEIRTEQTLKFPKNTSLFSAKGDGDTVVLTLQCPTSSCDRIASVRIHGTGEPLKQDIMDYECLGSVGLHGDYVMFHIFVK